MQLVKLAFVVASFVSFAAVRSAVAQPASLADPSTSQSVLPGVLPTSAGTTFDGRLDYTRFGDGGAGIPTLLGLNLHGQYVAPSGLGGYLTLPLAYASGNGDSESYLGNLDLGGLYVIRGANLDAYVRAAFVLGTSPDGLEGIVVPLAHLIPRPADAYVTGFGASWFRGGGGVRLTSGGLVVGGSGGVDFPLDSDGIEGVLHLTGSIGTSQPGFGLAVGITMVQSLDDSADSDDSFFAFQAVGDVVVSGKTRVYGAIGLNLEEDLDAFSLGFGVRAGF